MDKFFELLPYSIKAVGAIFLVAIAAVWLARRNIVDKNAFRTLSRFIFSLFSPALLFTKVASSISLPQLKEYWVFALSCVIFTFFGALVGKALSVVLKPTPFMRGGVAAAISFGNASYLPIPLLVAIITIFPAFGEVEKTINQAIAFVSVYLIGFAPLLWTVGYKMVGGENVGRPSLKKLFPPPVWGIILGVIVGLNPSLKSLFCSRSGALFPLFSAADVLAQATVPCALMVLGGSLANGPDLGLLRKRVIFSVIGIRLILFPILAGIYVFFLQKWGILPMGLLAALVLIIEAGAPPANNLVIMASLINHDLERGIATLLFWCYLASIITLTLAVIGAMWIFGS